MIMNSTLTYSGIAAAHAGGGNDGGGGGPWWRWLQRLYHKITCVEVSALMC